MKTGKIRGISDKTLSEALGNHGAVLRQVIGWIRRHDRVRWVTLVWQAITTVAVAYLYWVAFR